MKILIIISVVASMTGGYNYACYDTNGNHARMMMPNKFNVGDTVVLDSLYRVLEVKPKTNTLYDDTEYTK